MELIKRNYKCMCLNFSRFSLFLVLAFMPTLLDLVMIKIKNICICFSFNNFTFKKFKIKLLFNDWAIITTINSYNVKLTITICKMLEWRSVIV